MLRSLFVFLAFTTLAEAQAPEQRAAYRRQHESEIVQSFLRLLEMPNVAYDTPRGHSDISRNANYIADQFRSRGLKTRLLEVQGGFPAVYAELTVPGVTRTVVFYAHYDGQPVIPDRWKTPPFKPVVRNGEVAVEEASLPTSGPLPTGSEDWRIYARSASDDKAPIIGFLTALDALRANNISPGVNLKFFLEGEEEAGSAHLGEILTRYADLLKADLWLLCDGPVHQSGRMQLVYGARGVSSLEMTVYGPERALHSGHYGNWAPNPAAEIAEIIASMRDSEGRIKIKDFYATVAPPASAELKAIEQIPNIDSTLKQSLLLGRTEGGDDRLDHRLMLPALNVRGIRSGAVGSEASNAIPTQAIASIDFRLVPRQTPETVRQLVEAHLRASGYHIVSDEPTPELRRTHPRVVRLEWQAGYPAARTALDSKVAAAVAATMEIGSDTAVLRVPTLGGSVPMYEFEQRLHTPVLILPIANYDNNQHSHNENIRLGNLWRAIDVFATLFAELGNQWK